MERFKKPIIFIGIVLTQLIIGSSCSFFVPETDRTEKSNSYSINFNQSDWKEMDPDKSDYAFLHKRTNSVILLNSTCKKYEASSLNSLSYDLLAGFDNVKYEKKEEIKIYNRKGYHLKVKGSLDGIETYLLITSVKKNRCLYDFLLITNSMKTRKELTSDFNNFINSVTIQ